MEKEDQTFSISSSSNHSLSQYNKSFNLDNSLFSATPSNSFIDSVENFQPHNPYMKRPNHMIIKMFGKINGQPIPQTTYKLNTSQGNTIGLKNEMEKLESQNRQLKLKVKALQQTIIRFNLEKQKSLSQSNEDKENKISLKSKLTEKQHQYLHLVNSHSRIKQFCSSLQVENKQYKDQIKKLSLEMIVSKEQTNKNSFLFLSLKKQNQELLTSIQLQKQENIKLKIASAHQKTLQKQIESISSQLLVLKQFNNKLSKQNEGLKISLIETLRDKDPNATKKVKEYALLQEYAKKLQERVRVDQEVINQNNQDLVKMRLMMLNEKYSRCLY